MRIETEEQAQAARELDNAWERLLNSGFNFESLEAQRAQVKKALAAYESRSEEREFEKLNLTEREIGYFIGTFHAHCETPDVGFTNPVYSKLNNIGIVDGHRCDRAKGHKLYDWLKAQEAKPALKWEVWNGSYRVCVCEMRSVADFVAHKYNDVTVTCSTYEVREVQS